MSSLNVVVITGLSGAGKSLVLNCFEDGGYFCVDNLPPALMPVLVELCHQRGGDINKVALGIDLRERKFFADLLTNLDGVRSLGCDVELIFLEAREEVLVRRFSESRRPHPVLPQQPVLEGVRFERERLLDVRRRAHRIIDTSELTVHELKDLLVRHYLKPDQEPQIQISILTFGFKFGVPYDIDLLFDVRFLRNPHFVADLRPLTGDDTRVSSYIFEDPHAAEFMGHLERILLFLLPLFERERRSYLTIGIGCTGGRHRSVAIAGRLADILQKAGRQVTLSHRDVQKSA